MWSGLSIYVLADRLLFDLRQRAATRMGGVLRGLDPSRLSGEALREAVCSALAPVSARTLDRILEDRGLPVWAREACSEELLARRGLDRVLQDAAGGHGRRGHWRRIHALIALCRVGHPRILALLASALEDPDPDVSGTAVMRLGDLGGEGPARLLVEALRKEHIPGSRVATQLERFPRMIVPLLLPLLRDPVHRVRYWAAILLKRFPAEPGLDAAIEPLVRDPDASVRKAAVQTLGSLGGPLALAAALRLLTDPEGLVRAHAVRALAALGHRDHTERIAALLADQDWWVRLAAKESLVVLGPEVWREVALRLDSADPFARNGAAEVLQNLGILDRWTAEAARPAPPSEETLGLLAKAIRSGGRGFLDSAIARADAGDWERVLARLGQAGLELGKES